MDVQLDVNKILELTRLKLHEASDQVIMLHAVVEQQQSELHQLREALDQKSKEVSNAEDK